MEVQNNVTVGNRSFFVFDDWCVEVDEHKNEHTMTIKDFEEKKIAVVIKNKYDLKRFLEMCDKAGLKWRSGTTALGFLPSIENKAIVLAFGIDGSKSITYGSNFTAERFSYLYSGYTFVDVSEFFADNKKGSVKYHIVIDCDGDKTTVARMFVDGREVKHTKARRSPDDKFSLATGVKIAVDRLFEEK